MRIFRASAVFVFLLTALPVLSMQPLRTAAQTASCSEIMRARNHDFDANKKLLKDIATLRAAVQVTENQAEVLSGTAQESAKQALGKFQKSLKNTIEAQKLAAENLKKSDAELANCRGKQTESVGGDWAGTWRSGWKTITVSSVGAHQLRYTYSGQAGTGTEGVHSGRGACILSGSQASCTLQETGEGPGFHYRTEADETLTLSGSTIHAHTKYNTVVCSPDENPFCASVRQLEGKSVDATWERVR